MIPKRIKNTEVDVKIIDKGFPGSAIAGVGVVLFMLLTLGLLRRLVVVLVGVSVFVVVGVAVGGRVTRIVGVGVDVVARAILIGVGVAVGS